MPGNSDEQKNLLPGLKPVLELLKCDPDRVDAVYVRKGRAGGESGRVLDACRAAGVRFSLVPDDALARLAGRAAHQGVVARLRDGAVLPWPELLARAAGAPLPLLVALDQVQDPGNAGTLARTLYALGGAGLVLPRHNSAFLGPGARRAAAGALERLPVAQVVNLARAVDEAAEAGFDVYAARKSADSLNALHAPLRLPAMLVLGNEDKGVRPGVLKRCEADLAVPFLRDFDSLNVAQAGAILVSCFARSAAPDSAF